MANAEQLAILLQGVEAWNRWQEWNPRVIADWQRRMRLEQYELLRRV